MNRFKSRPLVLAGAVVFLILGLAACDQSAPNDSYALGEGQTAATRAASTTSPIVTFPALEPYDGESTLTRTANGINFRFTTNGLEPGHAYTIWVVIWNAPENCVEGCDAPDLFKADTYPDMVYGTGRIVGGSGQGTFSGRVQVGDASGSVQAPLGLAANGLMAPYDAEIHFFLHDHGPKLPAFMPDMIQTLAGGCTDSGVPAAGADTPWNAFAGSPDYNQEYGRLGPNACSSILVSVHQP